MTSTSYVSESTDRALTFAITGLAASLLTGVWGLFHIDLFLTVIGLHENSFYIGQTFFALWNAINDPLFGWMVDNVSWIGGRRLPAIMYGGPMWALAFLVPWFPWSMDGNSWLAAFHFVTSLCLFDTFLTYVLMVQCAMLCDVTVENRERNKLNQFNSLGQIAGSVLIMAAYWFWNREDLAVFRMFCIGVAGLSGSLFYYSAKRMKKFMPTDEVIYAGDDVESERLLQDDLSSADSVHEIHAKHDEIEFDTKKLDSPPKSAPAGARVSWWQFVKQVSSQANFWRYIVLNFMQSVHRTFVGGFLVIFDKKIFSPMMPPAYRWALVTCSMYAGKVFVQVATVYVNNYGKYSLVKICCITKIVAGIAMYWIGLSAWYLWAPLFFVVSVANCQTSFFDLIMADIIDEDTIRHHRPKLLSVSMHGLQALFTKPGLSLGPVLGAMAMSGLRYKEPVSNLSAPELFELQQSLYTTFVGIALICGGVQTFIWSTYTLKGKHLQAIKAARGAKGNVPTSKGVDVTVRE